MSVCSRYYCLLYINSRNFAQINVGLARLYSVGKWTPSCLQLRGDIDTVNPYPSSFRTVFRSLSSSGACGGVKETENKRSLGTSNVHVNKTESKKLNNIASLDTELESDIEEEDEMEDMFIEGPAGIEWNGPTRGGRRPEPTRYGDWERKGRVSDF